TDQNETPSHIDTEITDLPAYGTSTPTQCSAPQPAYGIAHNQIYVEQPGFPKRVSSQRGGGDRNVPCWFRVVGYFCSVRVICMFVSCVLECGWSSAARHDMVYFLLD